MTGFGVFDEAATEHAVRVPHKAIAGYGKPAPILSDHGSQFYANASECMGMGESEFEKDLVRLDIKHILARVRHQQTNGRLGRFHGEWQRKLPPFIEASADKTVRSREDSGHVGSPFHTKARMNPVSRFADWYDNERPRMYLDRDKRETGAGVCKMPPKGETVIDVDRRASCQLRGERLSVHHKQAFWWILFKRSPQAYLGAHQIDK